MEVTRRNCQKVIANMLEHIPEDNANFIKDLKWCYEDAKYKAPEETLQWERTTIVINKYIKDIHHKWEQKVVDIFTNKTQ